MFILLSHNVILTLNFTIMNQLQNSFQNVDKSMNRSQSASRKACDNDDISVNSLGQDKGKGRLRSENDSKVVGEEENRNLCIRHKNMADEGTSDELQKVLSVVFNVVYIY